MKTSRYGSVTLSTVVLLLGAVGAQPVTAQDEEPLTTEHELNVLVDEDGNVTVNGTPVTGDEVELEDGTRVRVLKNKGDGQVVIIEEDGAGTKIIRRNMRAVPGDPYSVWHRDGLNDGVPQFEWYGNAADRAREALDRVRHMRFDRMLPEDFDFDFDFEHINPEIMEMEAATRRLAREINSAEGSKRAEMERELSEKLSQIFDRKLEARTKRVQKLEERLEKQRAELNERQEARSEIIERRKAELLGEDVLKW